MQLKPLTAEESSAWMDTINRLADFYNSVQKYVREATNLRATQYNDVYASKWYKSLWHDLPTNYSGLIVSRDGTHHTLSFLHVAYLSGIDDYSEIEMKARNLVYHWVDSGRKEKVRRTMDVWCVYADIPFNISYSDLEMYFDVKTWLEELETIAKELGIDETYYMDEDSK